MFPNFDIQYSELLSKLPAAASSVVIFSTRGMLHNQ